VEGLSDIAAGLRRRRVGFVLRRYPDHRLLPLVDQVHPAIVVGDENPLRQTERWREQVGDDLRVPLWTVDADVVVPVKLQHKEHYAARTIRPRLLERLDAFLTISKNPVATIQWRAPRGLTSLEPSLRLLDRLPIDRSVSAITTMRGGTSEARRHLRAFVRTHLDRYARDRNHPELPGTSQLSPYLHFGHIGPREVGVAVRDSGGEPGAVHAFLEQLIVRRELAVNFVTFNDKYDALAGCERWARQTLAAHRRDRRPYLYTEARLEAGDTHDPLWNAAQRQMVTAGWMHGYVRMYWAKKILDWTSSADEAFDIAVRLNDRYLLDGRDPTATPTSPGRSEANTTGRGHRDRSSAPCGRCPTPALCASSTRALHHTDERDLILLCRHAGSGYADCFITLDTATLRIVVASFLLCLSAVAHAQTPAAQGPGQVAVVISVEGLRVPDVQVELRDLNANVVIARTRADAIGQVTFPDVAAGRYLVRATREGFADAESAPFDVHSGTTEQVLMEMRLSFVRENVEVILAGQLAD
jgi:deoxyribodipyrimidine photo-lyase